MGTHGTSKRKVKQLPLELWVANSGKEVKARMLFTSTKQFSVIHNVCNHFVTCSMVTKHKIEYRMRLESVTCSMVPVPYEEYFHDSTIPFICTRECNARGPERPAPS